MDRKEYMKEYNKKYREEHKEENKEHYKKYYAEHKEEYKQKNKKYREEHKEYMKEYHKKHKMDSKKYREEHKEHYKKYRKEHKGHIGIKGIIKPRWYQSKIKNWNQFGIKLIPPYITYYQMYAVYYIKAGKKCEICGKPLRMWYSKGISPEKYKDMETANFDHNHKTGEPRGILCTNCNYVVGIVERRLNGNAKNVSIYISKSDKNGKL